MPLAQALYELEHRGGGAHTANNRLWLRLIGRQDEHFVVRGGCPASPPPTRDRLAQEGWTRDGEHLTKEWLLQSDPDREKALADIERALDLTDPGHDHELVYEGPGSDAGFGQVGCVLIVPSAPVGAVIGLILVALTSGVFAWQAALIGLIAGWVSGGFAAWGGLELAVRIPRLRANAEEVGFGFALVAPAVIALLVTVVIGASASGLGLG